MKLSYVSASQVTAFQNCARVWHFGWVKKLKPPATASMERGTLIHAEAEHTVKSGGEIRATPFAPYIESMLPHLPLGEDQVLVEKKIELPVKDLIWTGYIDLIEGHVDPMRITDYKTTSDFRYAKTPAELSTNIQLISYAQWAYYMGHEGPIGLRHFYVKAAKKTPRKPKIKIVDVTVSQEHVQEVWDREIEVIDEMRAAALIDDTNLLPPTTTFCSAYGGCPHRSRCNIAPAQINWNSTNLKKKDELMANSFLDKLKAKKESNGEAEEKKQAKKETKKKETTKKSGSLASRLAAKKAAAAEGEDEGTPNEGVLPPDAPERTTPVKSKAEETETETEASAEEKPKRGRPKGSKNTKTTKKAKKADGFMLYIDCMPIKGETTDVPLFEDWVAPIIAKINEEVMEEKNLPSYQLLPFSEEKAIYNLAINEAVKDMPSALVVNSSSQAAREALAVLVPHAKDVVRGLR